MILIGSAFLIAVVADWGRSYWFIPKAASVFGARCQVTPGYTMLATTQCAEQYEALGFIRAENLTAEQRDTVGATSKRTASRVEQDVTIRPGAADFLSKSCGFQKRLTTINATNRLHVRGVAVVPGLCPKPLKSLFAKLNLLNDFILSQAQKLDVSGVAFPYPMPTLVAHRYVQIRVLSPSDSERLCQECVKLEVEMLPPKKQA